MFGAVEGIPVVVGVTGHRDIPVASVPSLDVQVRRLLCRIAQEHRDCPVVVMSSLADGADRICARAALDLGMRLVVPLPMEIGDYRRDFDEASAGAFDDLVSRADECFVAGDYETRPGDAPRGFGYRQAAIHVARHAHILIALWDGQRAGSPDGAGTYETVLLAREAGCAVCHIKTPRVGGAPEPSATCEPDVPDVPRIEALARVGQLNRDIARGGERLWGEAQSQRACLVPEGTPLAPRLARIADIQLLADALSNRHRRLKLLALRALSLLGLVLVLAFLLYDEMESDLMLAVYALCLLAALAWHFASRRGRFHEKYTTYRMMAEALRVQFYWDVAGVEGSAHDACAFTQKLELGFVDALLRALRCGAPTAPSPDAFACIADCWIGGQRAYHASSAGRKSKKAAIDARAARLTLVLSVALFALVAALEVWGKRHMEAALPLQPIAPWLWTHDGQLVTWRAALKILLGMISAGAAVLANYYGNLALPQQILSDERMGKLFADIEARLRRGMELVQAARLAGAESMNESANWYIDQREREIGLFIG